MRTAAPGRSVLPVNRRGFGYIRRMVRVLSCNLFVGRASAADLLGLVERHAVDIVCAQELTPALARRLADALPHGDAGAPGFAGGNAIASRHPVTMSRIAMPPRDACVASLAASDWPDLGQDAQIVNVHIAAPHLWPYFPRRARRRDQLRALLADRAGATVPHAVVGDFNASPAWAVYRRMREHYEDAAVVAANGARPANTWPSLPRVGLGGLLRIDHCFVNRLEVRAVSVVVLPGSDHRGLLVDLGAAEPPRLH